jgi:ABC-2 type transport system ATP-binding protein
MLETRGLTRDYGTFRAVDHLDLHVERGELFGFLGPNGAGKTTTVKMMVGLLRPTEGTVLVDGLDVRTETSRVKAKVGYVAEEPQLYDKLTVREFLTFCGELYGVPVHEARRRGDDWLDFMALAEQADKLIETLSHGLRQRVALGAALVHRPPVLFLDEPTVGLDPRSARQVKDYLRALCREGTTVFLTTHILEIAEKICDRVGILDRGRLRALGSLETLRGEARDRSLEDIFLELTAGTSDSEDAQAPLDLRPPAPSS